MQYCFSALAEKYHWNRCESLIHKRKTRQRPTLPCRYQHSTIGPDGLNFSVRNGKRCDPIGIATGNFHEILNSKYEILNNLDFEF